MKWSTSCCIALSAICALAKPLPLPQLPDSPFADTEVSTNIPFNTVRHEAQTLRAELSVFVREMSADGVGLRYRDLLEVCNRVDGLTNRLETASLMKDFEDDILRLDVSSLPYRERCSRIQSIFKAATLAAGRFPDRGQEYWAMRLRALAWVKRQIDMFANDGPANDPVMRERLKKDPFVKNIVNFIDREKDPTGKFDNWWLCLGGMNERFQGFVGDAAYEIEGTQPELRGWLRDEMAKIIVGRPLTDDDFGPHKRQVIMDRIEREMARHDKEARRPHDGGDVLPHPFTFLGCTFGDAYDQPDPASKYAHEDEILHWLKNFRIDPYFGKAWMVASLAPRSKVAFSAKIDWWGQDTRKDMFTLANDVKSDIEKRLGVKLGGFFFEDGKHVCDETTWWKASEAVARSRSMFGPIWIELEAADRPGTLSPPRRISLVITDTAAEAIAEKERRESPRKYDREAEMRRQEELIRRVKARQKMNQR